MRSDRTEYLRQWHQANKEERNSRRRQRYLENRQKELATALAWHRSNPEKTRASGKKYRQQPGYADYNRLRSARRRALERNATVNLRSIEAWVRRVRSFKAVSCYWCLTLVPTADIHFDHIIPITRGGAHSVENLCVSCPSCNHKKSDTLPHEWDRQGQMTLPL